MVIQNYEKPQVEVSQVFENVTPNPAGTLFLPCTVAPSFQIFQLETIGDPDAGTGYNGNANTYAAPFEPTTIVDTDPNYFDVFLFNEEYGTFLVSEADYDYDPSTNEVSLVDGISIKVEDGGTLTSKTIGTDINDVFEVQLSARAMRNEIQSDTNNDPYFISVSTTDEIEEELGPIIPENPLAWGMFWEVIATDTEVTGMLVSPESTDDVLQVQSGDLYHYLDLQAWQDAFERLETENVYNVIPTYAGQRYHNVDLEQSIISAAEQHVDKMSKPENQGERIATCVNPILRESNTETVDLVGVDADQQEFIIAGDKTTDIQPFDTLEVRESHDNHDYDGEYIIQDVIYNSTDDETSIVVGVNLTAPSDALQAEVTYVVDMDLDQIAENIRDYADSFNNRRLTLTIPHSAEAPVNGQLETVGGEILTNVIGGMDAFNAPQQPYTNLPMPAGINRLFGSNDMFNEEQLNTIASGGNYIIVQDVEGAPPYSRHQQTTNTEFIEKTERSIIKAVDYTAKLLRSNLERFIGSSNITEDLLASIRTSVQGLIKSLTRNGVIKDGSIVTLEQKDDQKDEIRLKVQITVLYPNNKIDVDVIV